MINRRVFTGIIGALPFFNFNKDIRRNIQPRIFYATQAIEFDKSEWTGTTFGFAKRIIR